MLNVPAISEPSRKPRSFMRRSRFSICCSSMKTPSSPGIEKSSSATKKVALVHAVVALRRHVPEGRAEQRAAEAVADRVDLALAGRLLDRVERGERAFEHVVLEVLAGEPRVRVHPRDDEHRVALLDRPPDERVLLAQIENVVLVDPGRNDEQRLPEDGLGRRDVLDELQQVVLEHDLAGRGGDVVADPERLLVAHLDAQLPVALVEVLEQVLQALHQVGAARLHRLAEHLRVGDREVRRRQRVDVLPGEEVDLLLRLVGQTLDARHDVVDVARRDQVALLHVVEDEVRLPVLVLEAVVALSGRCDRLGRLAEELQPRRLPQAEVVEVHVHLRLPERHRVREQFPPHVHEGARDAELVGEREPLAVRVAGHEVGEHVRRALGDLAEYLRDLDRVGRLLGFLAAHRAPSSAAPFLV